MKKITRQIIVTVSGFIIGYNIVSKAIPKIKKKLIDYRYDLIVNMRLDLLEAAAAYNYDHYKQLNGQIEYLEDVDVLPEFCVVSIARGYYIAEHNLFTKIKYEDLTVNKRIYNKIRPFIGKKKEASKPTCATPDLKINLGPFDFTNDVKVDANPDNPLLKCFIGTE